MIRNLLLALAAIAIASCTAPPPGDASATFIGVDGKPLVSAEGVIDSSVQEALTADPAACAKAGGVLQPVCRMGRPMCVVTFADAGKSCTDGSQCAAGRCYAKTPKGSAAGESTSGQCAASNNPCGCNQRVEDGVALPTLCVD
jgi:hypothetical protein